MFTYHGRLTRAVDGDTVDIDCDLGFSIKINVRFRLARINTPERGEDGFKEATNRMNELLDGKNLRIESKGKDKYGRWIAEIYTETGVNVSDVMLLENLANAY